MPYKVVGRCVHKLNADGSVGKIAPGGCHKSVEEAQAHKRALYANVEKEAAMSNSRIRRQKTRDKRKRQHELDELRKEDLEELDEELPEFEEAEPETLGPEATQKDFDLASDGYFEGPTSFEELDEARQAEATANAVQRVSWDVEDLVHNIVRSPMLESKEKAKKLQQVGTEFGERVQGLLKEPEAASKEHDMDLLEAEALMAQDERGQSLLARIIRPFQKKDLSYGERKGLQDSDFALVYEVDGKKERKYPIHDKAHVRNALARAAQQIKAGGEGAADARKALPKIKAAAKRMGIGSEMEKGRSGILIQKDAQGDWRWVGWPSNNFIDRSKDILTEAAHREYVDWWHKEKPGFPVFTSMHAPGTTRSYPVDFVGYENGFLVMSGKLTEAEAAGLLRVQKEYELGMSHTGWGIRSADDPRQIVMYRIYEVTDLPLEMADNPFTDLAVMSKEAEMKPEDQVKYLEALLGSEELAKSALSAKTAMKQKELQEAGVEQKEIQEEAKPEATAQAAPDMAAILEAVSKEFDIEGLSEAFAAMNEAVEKVGLLENVIKQQQATIQALQKEQDEALAEKLAPPAGRFAWSFQKRASQAKETEVGGKELESLQKTQAGIPDSDEYWLSQTTGTVPVPAEA